MHTCIIVNILLICVLASARGGQKIFVGSKSSAYMRNNPDSQWSSRYFEPVTAEMIINADNFDIVRFEGRRVATRSSDCPTNITGKFIRTAESCSLLQMMYSMYGSYTNEKCNHYYYVCFIKIKYTCKSIF